MGVLPFLSPGKKGQEFAVSRVISHNFPLIFIFQGIYFCKILYRSETDTQPLALDP